MPAKSVTNSDSAFSRVISWFASFIIVAASCDSRAAVVR
jgi:hypothetical protein